jgi:hypothetical protein
LYKIVKLFFISFGYITLYKDNLPDFPLFQGRFAPAVLLAPSFLAKRGRGLRRRSSRYKTTGVENQPAGDMPLTMAG